MKRLILFLMIVGCVGLASFAEITDTGPISNDPITCYALKQIKAPEAWKLTKGKPSVVIGLIETSVDTLHEDLRGQVIHIQGGSNSIEDDHGTSIAGTIAALNNNGKGISGIASHTKLAVYRPDYKWLNSNKEQLCKELHDAIMAAHKDSIRIINVSWAENGLTPEEAKKIVKEGTVLVLAAGNDGPEHHSEISNIPGVILVAANDSTGEFYSGYSIGPNVDICAPGRDLTHLTYYTSQPTWHNLYGIKSGNGSSFSAAFVSGAIALMRAVNPDLTPERIEFILYNTRQEFIENPISFDDPQKTLGYLNTYAAVQKAIDEGTTSHRTWTGHLPFQKEYASSLLRFGNYPEEWYEEEWYWDDYPHGVTIESGHSVLETNYAVDLYEGFSVQEGAELDIVILD